MGHIGPIRLAFELFQRLCCNNHLITVWGFFMWKKTKENYSYWFVEEPSPSKHEDIIKAIDVLEKNKIGYHTSESQKDIDQYRKISKRFDILSENIQGYLAVILLCLPGLFYYLFWENSLFITKTFVLIITFLLIVGMITTIRGLKKINIYED